MKDNIKQFIRWLVHFDLVWNLFRRIVIPLSDFGQAARYILEDSRKPQLQHDKLTALFSDKVIQHGPFKGMKYLEPKHIHYAYWPKLLGSYESELHPWIESWHSAQYANVVDIGCAEGYYAVGLAILMPNVRVFAFDNDPIALDLCRNLARLNGVENQIETGVFCDAKMLASLPLTKKSLIISDCEGYEKRLFTEDNINNLRQHDVLIEVHDFVDIEISGYLKRLFSDTHSCRSVYSVDDIVKVHTYRYPELEGLSSRTRLKILAERRPHIMEWYFFEALHG